LVIIFFSRILKLNNVAIPVYKGQTQPLVVNVDTGPPYHGSDGLNDVKQNDVQVDENHIQQEKAVSAMVRLINENPHMVELIGKKVK